MSSTVAGVAGVAIAAQCTGPDPGDAVTAASIRVGEASIENDLATVKAGTYTTTATVTHTGADVFSDPVTFSIGQTVAHNGTEVFNGIVQLLDRVEFPPAGNMLSDAAHTIDVGTSTYYLPNAPAAQRAITLSTIVGPPKVGERIRVVIPACQDTLLGHQPYQFTRSGTPAGLVAKVLTSTVVTYLPIFVEFEFAPGLVLGVTGTASGTSSRVRLTLAFPTGWGSLGNPTDSLATGDQVVVANVTGTTEANGTWVITVNDGTHITLTGTTFANAWVSGGTAQITPGTWRLAGNSGSSYDGTSTIGVLPDGAS